MLHYTLYVASFETNQISFYRGVALIYTEHSIIDCCCYSVVCQLDTCTWVKQLLYFFNSIDPDLIMTSSITVSQSSICKDRSANASTSCMKIERKG